MSRRDVLGGLTALPALGPALFAGPRADRLGNPARLRLRHERIIIESDDAHFRDPSGVLLHDGEYHLWATRVPLGGRRGGYWGAIRHLAAPDPKGPWEDRGTAIAPAKAPDAWDGLGTFTCDATRDPADGRWYLFYSGTRRGFSNERNPQHFSATAIGGAWAESPDGPWHRFEHNPLLQTGDRPRAWNGLRIDEAQPLMIRGQRRLYMRGVRLLNEQPFRIGTAPGLYRPDEPNTWHTTYRLHPDSPFLRPPGDADRFEAYGYLPGPDGLMHMTNEYVGADHPPGTLGHHVSADGLHWRFVGNFRVQGPRSRSVIAPHPVWAGATPGQEGSVTAMVDQFAKADGKLRVRLLELRWV